jgi:hypothetical protein
MTHEFVGVVVDPFITRDTAHDVVEKIIAPFQETYDEGTDELSGWWDFWMIGGRWTGVWLKGYEAHEDPLNIDLRPCFICTGTGQREDIGDMSRADYVAFCGGCNGCGGKGHQVVWPSRYRPIAEDVLPVATLIGDPELRTPRRLVLPDTGVLSREDDFDGDKSWDPSPEWDALVRDRLAPFRNAAIAVVDVHV